MYDYPPREFLLREAISSLAIPVAILAITGYVLFRRGRSPKSWDVWVWFAASLGAMVIGWATIVPYTHSPTPADGVLSHGLLTLMTAAVPCGMLACLRRSHQVPSRRQPIANIFMGLFFALTGLTLLTPGLADATPTMWRAKCTNNLKQLAGSLHQYHIAHGGLPAAAFGTPAVGWRITLLPFLEASDVEKVYDRSQSWDSAANRPLMFREIPAYTCPADSRPHLQRRDPLCYTAYAAPVGTDTVWQSQTFGSLRDIPDGASQTLLLVEACGAKIVWTEPRDLDVPETPLGINLPGKQPGYSSGLISSRHGDIANVAFADGSIRLLSSTIDTDVLSRLIDRNGGKPAGDF